MLHNFVYLYFGITLGCGLGALLGLKNTTFGIFFMFVQNTIMYVVIVVFVAVNSNLQVPIPESLSFTLFWDVFHVSWGLLGLKITQNVIFTKKTFFGAYILIDLLNLTFLKFREICSYLYEFHQNPRRQFFI